MILETAVLVMALAAPLTVAPMVDSRRAQVAMPDRSGAKQTTESLVNRFDSDFSAAETEVTVALVDSDVLTLRQLVHDEIASYGLLRPGWDDADALVPDRSQLWIVSTLVDELSAVHGLPKPMVSATGSVGLYWDFADRYADIEVEGDGSISVFTKLRSAPPVEQFEDGLKLNTAGIEKINCLMRNLLN
jgi:hypothetical protein